MFMAESVLTVCGEGRGGGRGKSCGCRGVRVRTSAGRAGGWVREGLAFN